VHATDQANPAPYLHGGEVVLTDGLWMAGGTTPSEYVRRLADANAAAIGFGLIEGQAPPAQALVRACRRRGVTLFSVPVDVPFLAISELFVERMIEEHEEPLRRTLRRSERLLEAVSAPDGARRVLEELRDELGLDACLCDGAGAVVAHAGRPPDGDAASWPAFRVPGPSGEDAHLRLRRGQRPLTVDERTAVQQTLTVLGIDAAHREALRETHRRFAAELFELAREAESEGPAIARRLRGLGLDPDGTLVAVMCDVPAADERLTAFEAALRAAGLRAVATSRAGRLTAIAEWDPRASAEAVSVELAAAMGPRSAVGVGSPVGDCSRLDVSLGDARRACRLARLRQDGRQGATVDDLTSYAGLLAQQDPDVLEHFCRRLLDPLTEHDATRGSALLATVTAFLSSGGRWAATAADLHVHVNTLRHRLARVEELTGRSLDDPDDRVDFRLALRARGLTGRPAARS
jgi:hypothetical protein